MDEVTKGEAKTLALKDYQAKTDQKVAKNSLAVRVKPVGELSPQANPGGYAPSVANAQLALQQLGINLRFDAFHMRVEVEGYDKPLGETFEETVLKLRNVVSDSYGFDPGKHHMHDAARLLALRNSYDPIRDYLDGLKWDGRRRLDTWMSTYLRAEDDALTRAMGRAVLIGGVRRVRQPGCKFDFILVLEGTQGTGKSTALKVLAGGEDNFTDEIVVGVSYKEQQELLRGKWIVEMPEMAGLSKADVQRTKQFATKTYDRARGAWGRAVEELPRRCIMIGTTNDSEYLQDPTGNRRFWPVETGVVDLAGLARDRDQLWAEAAMAEPDAGEPVTIPQELWAAAAERQAARTAAHPWEDILARGLAKHAKEVEGELRIPSTDVLENVLGLSGAREMRMSDTKTLATCMRKLGWSGPKVIRWKRGELVRGYVKERRDGG